MSTIPMNEILREIPTAMPTVALLGLELVPVLWDELMVVPVIVARTESEILPVAVR